MRRTLLALLVTSALIALALFLFLNSTSNGVEPFTEKVLQAIATQDVEGLRALGGHEFREANRPRDLRRWLNQVETALGAYAGWFEMIEPAQAMAWDRSMAVVEDEAFWRARVRTRFAKAEVELRMTMHPTTDAWKVRTLSIGVPEHLLPAPRGELALITAREAVRYWSGDPDAAYPMGVAGSQGDFSAPEVARHVGQERLKQTGGVASMGDPEVIQGAPGLRRIGVPLTFADGSTGLAEVKLRWGNLEWLLESVRVEFHDA